MLRPTPGKGKIFLYDKDLLKNMFIVEYIIKNARLFIGYWIPADILLEL